MAIGDKIEDRSHIIGFKEEIRSASSDEDRFFTWFDAAQDARTAFINGAWDFSYHIALAAIDHVRHPESLAALEIGVGGGRLLAAASRHFGRAVGVDIHDELHLTRQKLIELGCSNTEVLKSDGTSIPVDAESIDFVYSFIVFNHLEKRSIVVDYMEEIRRVLKPGGVAVIYFGRCAPASQNKSGAWRYWVDRLVELAYLPQGYKELPAKVNCTNLIFTLPHFKRLARGCGFQILRRLVSRKKVPNGVATYGMQHGLVLRRP